jgi:hypothetical protein
MQQRFPFHFRRRILAAFGLTAMMRSSATLLSALCFALILSVAGCGGDSDGEAGGEAAATTTAATDGTTTGLAPDELVGTFTTTLEKSDLPADPPPELADGGPSWVIRIGNRGGPSDGPFLAIDSADEEFGNLEAPALHVDGDRLMLIDEECAAGGEIAFYDNEYRWKLSGRTLTITTIKNQCSDRVAETILTSRPWAKAP